MKIFLRETQVLLLFKFARAMTRRKKGRTDDANGVTADVHEVGWGAKGTGPLEEIGIGLSRTRDDPRMGT